MIDDINPHTANIKNMSNDKIQLTIKDNFEYELFKVYNDNTLVFIDTLLHSTISPSVKASMGLPEEEDDGLTPQEILAKDVMYILTDKDFDIEEFLMMANSIKGSEVKYLIIYDLLY